MQILLDAYSTSANNTLKYSPTSRSRLSQELNLDLLYHHNSYTYPDVSSTYSKTFSSWLQAERNISLSRTVLVADHLNLKYRRLCWGCWVVCLFMASLWASIFCDPQKETVLYISCQSVSQTVILRKEQDWYFSSSGLPHICKSPESTETGVHRLTEHLVACNYLWVCAQDKQKSQMTFICMIVQTLWIFSLH